MSSLENALPNVLHSGKKRNRSIGQKTDRVQKCYDDYCSFTESKSDGDDVVETGEEGNGSLSDEGRSDSDSDSDSDGEAALPDNMSQSLQISVVRKEYPGFSFLGPDLYVSAVDPCLQVEYPFACPLCYLHSLLSALFLSSFILP